MLVDMRGGVAANVIGLLIHDPVVIAKLLQTIARAQPSRPRSDDDNLLAHKFRFDEDEALPANDSADK
jgi:hypothetical protein